MSLADKIIENRTAPSFSSVDELGIPNTVQNIDYYAARAIKRNKYLHSEDGELYNKKELVKRQAVEMAILTGCVKMNANLAALVYYRILELVPKVDHSAVAVTPHLLWHLDTQKLEETEEEILTNEPWKE